MAQIGHPGDSELSGTGSPLLEKKIQLAAVAKRGLISMGKARSCWLCTVQGHGSGRGHALLPQRAPTCLLTSLLQQQVVALPKNASLDSAEKLNFSGTLEQRRATGRWDPAIASTHSRLRAPFGVGFGSTSGSMEPLIYHSRACRRTLTLLPRLRSPWQRHRYPRSNRQPPTQ